MKSILEILLQPIHFNKFWAIYSLTEVSFYILAHPNNSQVGLTPFKKIPRITLP